LLSELHQRRHLQNVYWYGHGASAELQFGSGKKLTEMQVGLLPNADLSTSFEPTGEIFLIACNAAQSPAFLQAIADALHVRVRGYTTGIEWAIDYTGETPHRKVTRRGLRNAVDVLKSGQPYMPRPPHGQGGR